MAVLGDLEKRMKDSKEYLMKVGYEEIVLEDFLESVIEVIEKVKKSSITVSELIDLFCDKVRSDSLVMYARFLTGGYLKANAILYETFLDEGITIEDFCRMEVEPIDRECDQMQITALLNYVEIPVEILYLDSSAKATEASLVRIPESADPSKVFVKLLYRPGHYDILYK
eukprot:TRINITY_DN1500_c0_g1_i2.p1 TRINITY_DN1500_c0_g1~~TRINITY_DN1500_c0_g1_i2.p1  ORF type:complete len:170 (-),score=51.34 TRINITY_DN1500_c0_g1_i2:118-627(-)